MRPTSGARGRQLLLAVVLLIAPLRAAFAHSFAPAVLDLRERAAGVFDVIWKLPSPELGTLGLGDAAQPEFPAACRPLSQPPAADPVSGEPAYWRVDCGAAALHGARISVGGLTGSRVDVIVRISWRDGSAASGVLRSGADDFTVPAAAPAGGVATGAPTIVVLWRYGRIGVEHILFGVDHLLFVLGLMLLVASRRLLVKTISAFTLAHSLSLALAVLGVIRVPPAPVEAMIALSIVLVALELTRPPNDAPTLARRYPWLVAFVFGLLHGLGFAGALAQVGLPPDQLAVALFSFNVGVEIGQLLFVAAMLAPLAGLTRLARRWAPARLVPAYAIGMLAVAWTLERIGRFWALPS